VLEDGHPYGFTPEDGRVTGEAGVRESTPLPVEQTARLIRSSRAVRLTTDVRINAPLPALRGFCEA